MGSLTAPARLDPSERAELEWLLESGALGRSANLTKVLRYIYEETAAGRAEQIKEYSIAVDALGRKTDFDPQNDTIVRVTIHTLRKRLQDLYESGEGASHPVRVVIPGGGYAVQFLHIAGSAATETAESSGTVQESASGAPPALAPHPPEPVEAMPVQSGQQVPWKLLIAVTAILVVAASIWPFLSRNETHRSLQNTPSPVVTISGPTRILLGEGRHPYTDHSGEVWTPQPACQGGEPVHSTGAAVSDTQDSYVYDGGLRGIVRCIFHARVGFYELRLYFAEPGNLEPAQRVVTLSVNAGPLQTVDVVDRAGADHAAITYTIPGVSPENDGTIHLDYTSEVSPVNAIEILPSPSAQPLPVRLVASSESYKDDQGNLWLSDRYFRGGRHGQPPDHEHRPGLGLYASNRIGTFVYAIPAPLGSKYRVTLYFREAWFGQSNRAAGGPGSRIFDVYCNGQTIIHNFDILAESGGTVTKRVEHLSPTALGMLNLQFVPVVNYPLVNAIEVVPEQP
jgi:Malectin domain